MLPNDCQWAKFNQSLHRRTGLDLNQYKPGQMQRRVWGMVAQQKLSDLDSFYMWLAASEPNMVWFLDKIAINVSELFRNVEKWRELETIILPDLLSRSSKLKCWSAGCSYGAEAYSLAAILDSKFSGVHNILATDIDQAALSQAREGIFSREDFKGVPDTYRKYFPAQEDRHKADSKLSRYINVKKHNVLADPFETGFDLIMCRNVVIYFTDEAKDQLYARFLNSLKPGGVLFVGSTERIFNFGRMGYESNLPFFYTKPLTGEQRWRNAS